MVTKKGLEKVLQWDFLLVNHLVSEKVPKKDFQRDEKMEHQLERK